MTQAHPYAGRPRRGRVVQASGSPWSSGEARPVPFVEGEADRLPLVGARHPSAGNGAVRQRGESVGDGRQAQRRGAADQRHEPVGLLAVHLGGQLLDTASGTDGPHAQRQRREGDRAQQLEAQTSDLEALGRLVTFEGRADQRREGAAVERLGVPRAAGLRGRDKTLAVGLEDALTHRLERSQEKPLTAR